MNVGGVQIDENNIASDFVGGSRPTKYLLTIDDDKFDFSGDFDIELKCSDIKSSGPLRRDLFAPTAVDGTENVLMDIGMMCLTTGGGDRNGHYGCWEIANPAQYGELNEITGSNKLAATNVEVAPGPFRLKVTRRSGVVKCYVQIGDYDWILDFDGTNKRAGNYAPGTFALGIDVDSPAEWFPGKIHLDSCVLYQRNPNSLQHVGAYFLRPAV